MIIARLGEKSPQQHRALEPCSTDHNPFVSQRKVPWVNLAGVPGVNLAATGSGWDAAQGPDTTAAHHLSEWVTGSAVDPALAAANVQSLRGWPVLEALAGDRLEQLGGWAQQYATGPVARLLEPLEPIAAAGGWWCSGLDPLADWAPMGWGCFKSDAPRGAVTPATIP